MNQNISYVISINHGELNKLQTDEIKFTFSNPLIARSLAIQETKRILKIAKKQLKNSDWENEYGIGEWDNPSLIYEIPEMIPMLKPFSISLVVFFGDTNYVLFGEGIESTLEALDAEVIEYSKQGLLAHHYLTEILVNKDYSTEKNQPAYLFCERLSYVPEFRFTQCSILSQDSDFLLNA